MANQNIVPCPATMNFMRRAGISHDRAYEYCMVLRQNEIPYLLLSDLPEEYLLNEVNMAYGDMIRMIQAIDMANAWKELFIQIGISEFQSTLYGLKFSSEQITRSVLHNMKEKHLTHLGVNSVGDKQKMLKAAKMYLLMVPCECGIKVSDNQRVLREYQDMLDDNDRRLLQYVSTTIVEEGITVMSNAEIHVYGGAMHVIYVAGNGGNLFEVQLYDGVPNHSCTRRYEDTTRFASSGIGCCVGAACGLVAGAVLGFITLGPAGAIAGAGIGSAGGAFVVRTIVAGVGRRVTQAITESPSAKISGFLT